MMPRSLFEPSKPSLHLQFVLEDERQSATFMRPTVSATAAILSTSEFAQRHIISMFIPFGIDSYLIDSTEDEFILRLCWHRRAEYTVEYQQRSHKNKNTTKP
jgi:hypothetical protein